MKTNQQKLPSKLDELRKYKLIDLPKVNGFQVNVSQFWACMIFLKMFNGEN